MSSDWASKNFLYFVSVDTLIRLFRAVGSDDVVEVQCRRGRDGVMRVVKATRGKSAPNR